MSICMFRVGKSGEYENKFLDDKRVWMLNKSK